MKELQDIRKATYKLMMDYPKFVPFTRKPTYKRVFMLKGTPSLFRKARDYDMDKYKEKHYSMSQVDYYPFSGELKVTYLVKG